MNMMTQAFDKAFPFDKTFPFGKAFSFGKASPLGNAMTARTVDGKAGLESAMKGLAAVAKTNQTAGIEWADFARQSYAEGTATMKKLAAARTPQAALEIQAAYLKGTYERMVAQAQTLRDLYSGLAGTIKSAAADVSLPATR